MPAVATDMKNTQVKEAKATQEPRRDADATKRLQVDLEPQDVLCLQKVKRLGGEKSNTNVVRRAVRFYGWALGKGEEGYKLQLVRDDHVVEVAVF
jgi:hypothetical protein